MQTRRCDVYGQDARYDERVMLIYDGLHYDALAVAGARSRLCSCQAWDDAPVAELLAPAHPIVVSVSDCPYALCAAHQMRALAAPGTVFLVSHP